MLYALACVKDFGDTTVAVSRGEATIVGFLSQQTDDARAVLVENKHRHGEAKVLEVLRNAEEVSGEVVVENEVLDFSLGVRRRTGDAVLQAGSVADLGVEALAGCQCFVLLDEREQVERHLIVAAPGNIRERIVYDSRHDVNVLTEHGGRVDGERGAGLEARKRLDGIVVEFGKREVHN